MARSSLHRELCAEYPDISGPAIEHTIASAGEAVAHLGSDVSSNRLAALARDRLDIIRIRSLAATRRSAGRSGDGQPPDGPLRASPRSVAHAMRQRTERQPPPPDPTVRLWAALRAQSDAGAEVDADLLCRTATVLLDVAAVAVSVPDPVLTLRTIGAHGPHARSLGELETELGQGPCLDALAAGDAVIADLVDEQAGRRWPLFAPACSAFGVVMICALPLRMGAARCGVLAVYLSAPARRAAALRHDAEGFAEIALELLLADISSPERNTGASQSGGDLRNDHPEIHHATGMTSVQLGVDLGTAVVCLRERALADGRTLLGLAADIVAGSVRLDRNDV